MAINRPGRPVGTGLNRTKRLRIQVTPEEKNRIEQTARKAGLTLSEYVRRKVLQ